MALPTASDNVFPKVILSEGAAPSTPSSGQVKVYAKSDGHVYSKDDAGVETRLSAGAQLDLVTFTSPVSVTATSEATANTVVTATAITFDGSTSVEIIFQAPAARPDLSSNAIMRFYLYDGSNSIGRLGTIAQPTYTPSSAVGVLVPVRLSHILAPSAASHTYSIRADVSSGTGSVSAGAGGSTAIMPGYVRILRV